MKALTRREAKRSACSHWARIINAKTTSEGHGSMTCPVCEEWPQPESKCTTCRRLSLAQDELLFELQRRGDES